MIVPLLLVLALVGAACGDDDGGEATASDEAPAADETEAPSGEVGEGPGTPEPQPLPGDGAEMTIAYPAALEAFAPTLVADHFDEFEKENLDITLQQISIPDAMVLLSQGRIDMQLTGLNAGAFNQVAEGTDFRYVASQFTEDTQGAGHYIHKDYLDENGDPDFEALQGARTVFGIGGGGHGNSGGFPLWRWANDNELDLRSLEAVNVPSPADAAQAIINGNVAIAIGLTPAWIDISESGCCELLVDQIVAAPFLTTQSWLDENPDVADAFFRAIMRTNRTYLDEDYREDDEVIAALSEITGQPEADLAGIPPLTFPQDLELGFRDLIVPYQEFFQENEQLSYEELIQPDEVIDTSPVDRILAGD